MNVCYNELATAAHNERRAKHEASALVWDGAIAAALQKAMAAVPAASLSAMASTLTVAATSYVGVCAQNVYEETDPVKVVDLPVTDAATAGWYKGKADFDFDKGAVKHKALLPALATTAAQADKDALAAANIKITADNAKATKRAN